MPAPADLRPPAPQGPRLPVGLQRSLLCLGLLDLTAIAVLALMQALYAPPFTTSGGLAFPLLPLILARLTDMGGLCRKAKPGYDALATSVLISAVQVCLACMAAALYGRGALRAPAIAAVGLAGGEAAIFGVGAAALATRRRWWGGGAARPAATAPTAGTGRPAALATSESTVALTDLCPERSHSPPKHFVAVVQPSGHSFCVAAVADGTAAGPPPPPPVGPLDSAGLSPPRPPRPSADGLAARRGGDGLAA